MKCSSTNAVSVIHQRPTIFNHFSFIMRKDDRKIYKHIHKYFNDRSSESHDDSRARETRRTLAQLRTNKSPLLVSYLFSIGDPRHPSPLCPLCLMHDHNSSHLFECKSLPTSLSSLDLWTNPDKVEPFLATWGERLLAAT